MTCLEPDFGVAQGMLKGLLAPCCGIIIEYCDAPITKVPMFDFTRREDTCARHNARPPRWILSPFNLDSRILWESICEITSLRRHDLLRLHYFGCGMVHCSSCGL